MPPPPPRPDDPGREPKAAALDVEALFDAWLVLQDGGGPESTDFEAFCARHPSAADDLRRLRAAFDRFAPQVDALDEQLDASASQAGSETRLLAEHLASHSSAADEMPTVELDLESDARGRTPSDGASASRSFARIVERLGKSRPAHRRYTNGREVARGGMGAIVKTWDSDLRRYLAMKVMLPPRDPSDTSSEERRLGRFLEEAQITGQLDHPGIVPVHEIGRDATGRLFFTMRFVRGRSFGEIVDLVHAHDKDGWTLARALDVLLKVCDTLDYAHSKDVVHRDIKPANIMVGRFGEVYVMDWGLAKVMGRAGPAQGGDPDDTETSLIRVESDREDLGRDPNSPLRTAAGAVVGTPAYMSPEQAMGRNDLVGPATDVYAVGALMYFLLAGEAPYIPAGQRVSSQAVLEAVRRGPPRRLSHLGKRMPGELVSICNKAMARSVGDRYPSMRAMADDLRAFTENRVVRAARTGAVAELNKWVMRNKPSAVVVLVSIVALLVGLLRLFEMNEELRRSNEEAGFAAAEATQNATRAQLSEQRAQQDKLRAEQREAEALAAREREARATYAANIEAADGRLRYHEVTEARRRLDACGEELRGFEWDHLSLAADSSLAAWAGHTGPVTRVAFTQRGSDFVTASRDGTVAVWNKVTRTPLVRVEHGRPVTSVACDPEGRIAAFGDEQGTIVLFDTFEGDVVQRLAGAPRTGAVTSLVFGAAGSRKLFAGYASGSIFAWDLAREQSTPYIGHMRSVTDLALAPFGTLLASGGSDNVVHLWDALGNEAQPLSSFFDAGGTVRAVAFHPAGDRIAAAASTGRITVFGVQRDLPALTYDAGASVSAVSFTADGGGLVAGTDAHILLRWDLSSPTPVARLLGHAEPITGLAVDPHGELLVSASADGELRAWDEDLLGGTRVLDDDLVGARALALSPDGRRLVTSADDGRVLLWDAILGIPLDALDTDGGFHEVAWSPTGGTLALGPGYPREDGSCPIRLIDVAGDVLTGRAASLDGHRRGVDVLVFSPDGTQLASGGKDGRLLVWDAARGVLVREFEGHDILVYTVDFDPRGARLVSGSADQTLRSWDLSDGSSRILGATGGWVTAAAYAPDGDVLAVARDDRQRDVIELVDPTSGDVLDVLHGHTGDVLALAWHPGGRRLASAAADGTILLWDRESRQRLLTLRPGETVTSLAFEPGGRRLFACRSESVLVYETEAPAARLEMRRRMMPVLERGRREFWERLHTERDPRDVLRALVADTNLDAAVRADALRRARLFGQDPERLAGAAWLAVLDTSADPEAVREALTCARVADRLRPDDPWIRGVLGGAALRAGDAAGALVSLQRAASLDPDGHRFPRALLHFLSALALLELGDEAGARRSLAEGEGAVGLLGTGEADLLAREVRRQLALGELP